MISSGRAEDASTFGDKNRPMQSLLDQLRYYDLQNLWLKGELMTSRREHEVKDALIKDLQDQLRNLKGGNREVIRKLFETNEVLRKQQCTIVNMLMTNDGETNSPSQATTQSGDGVGNFRDQQSSQPSTSGGGRMGKNGGQIEFGVPLPPTGIEEYDPAAPMMTRYPKRDLPQQSSNISNGRSLLNPFLYPDSNIILSSRVSSIPKQGGTKRLCIKQEKKD